MTQPIEPSSSLATRRDFIKTTGRIAAASALAGVALPHVHAQGSSTVQVALVGCGGRGTGAAANALSTLGGSIQLTAMADVFQDRMDTSYTGLKEKHKDLVDVPNDKKFIGFDGYKHAIDSLKKGDVAIFATPPAFRWVHFQYAIEKGVNVFMEKPVVVDAGSGKRMLDLYEKANQKNLKVGVGLMCRHCRVRQELFQRIKQGEIGDIIALRAYRMHGPVASAFSTKKPENQTEVEYQIRRFHSFLWASGGLFSDYYIHNIDEACWMKDSFPVKAQASGGRHFRGDYVDQNFDNYSVEYTFDDGVKLFFYGRTMAGCKDEFATYAHGSKGLAVVSSASHTPARSRIFKGQNIKSEDLVWRGPKDEPDPYQLEWQDLLDAIRNNTPYNEVKRGVQASLTAAMGRFAAHTGQEVTLEDFMANGKEFAPDVDKLTVDGPAPVMTDAQGKYPTPRPGVVKDTEY
jgi:predicted dehydrogenase